MKNSTMNITTGALIAAIYVVLTLISQAAGLASGVIQVRISEALTILPLFTWAAVPGLAVGCLIANIMTGCALWDIIFGTLATLIGGIGTYLVGRIMGHEAEKKHSPIKEAILGSLAPIISNSLIVPFILQIAYGADGTYLYFVGTIGVGEIISCGVLGVILFSSLKGKLRF